MQCTPFIYSFNYTLTKGTLTEFIKNKHYIIIDI